MFFPSTYFGKRKRIACCRLTEPDIRSPRNLNQLSPLSEVASTKQILQDIQRVSSRLSSSQGFKGSNRPYQAHDVVQFPIHKLWGREESYFFFISSEMSSYPIDSLPYE